MRAFVGLGSNLGDREATVRAALEQLSQLPETTLLRVSSLYDSEPVGPEDQPDYVNAVAQLDTGLTARQLLWNLALIEKRLGRVRSQRWGPRTIDLDLLFFGDQVIDDDDLRVPHPEITRRAFVLAPLAELEPGLLHPLTGQTIGAHLAQLHTRPPVRRPTRLWN